MSGGLSETDQVFRKSELTWPDFVVLGGYFVAVIGVGIWVSDICWPQTCSMEQFLARIFSIYCLCGSSALCNVSLRQNIILLA